MIKSKTFKMGEHRGTPRIYVQGQHLKAIGFDAGRHYEVRFGDGSVQLVVGDSHYGNGQYRKVSIKNAGASYVPVLDIASERLAEALHHAAQVTLEFAQGSITITPSRVEAMAAARQLDSSEASLFSGGGLLTQAARSVGFTPLVANEINEDYGDIFNTNHPTAEVHVSSVENVPWDTLKRYNPGLLTMGIPCEPFSRIRTMDKGTGAKRDKSLPPEAHDLGDMTYFGIRAIEAMNPHTVIIEEVPDFLKSGAAFMLMHVMRRFGYIVDSRIIDPIEYGELTGRKRAVIVATAHKTVNWPIPCPKARTLAEILEPEDAPGLEWWDRHTKSWVIDHWESQTAKGNGFAPPILFPHSTSAGTIKKKYFAGQGDNPVVGHTKRPGVYRWLTIDEVKRLHGLPDNYYLGPSKTIAGEVVGQGVVVSLFTKIIASVTGRPIAMPSSPARTIPAPVVRHTPKGASFKL